MRYFRTLGLAAAILAGSATASAAAIAEAPLNIRSGPGTNYPVVATIPAGGNVNVGGCSGSWCSVAYRGREGFASASYLAGGRRGAVRQRYTTRYYDDYDYDDGYYGYDDDYPSYAYTYGYYPSYGYRRGGGRYGYNHRGRGDYRGGYRRGNRGYAGRGDIRGRGDMRGGRANRGGDRIGRGGGDRVGRDGSGGRFAGGGSVSRGPAFRGGGGGGAAFSGGRASGSGAAFSGGGGGRGGGGR